MASIAQNVRLPGRVSPNDPPRFSWIPMAVAGVHSAPPAAAAEGAALRGGVRSLRAAYGGSSAAVFVGEKNVGHAGWCPPVMFVGL